MNKDRFCLLLSFDSLSLSFLFTRPLMIIWNQTRDWCLMGEETVSIQISLYRESEVEVCNRGGASEVDFFDRKRQHSVAWAQLSCKSWGLKVKTW